MADGHTETPAQGGEAPRGAERVEVDPYRMKAAEMLDKAGIGHDERAWKLIGYVAAALSEERAKARAPFLALAEAAERQAEGYRYVAATLIRRAAEETA